MECPYRMGQILELLQILMPLRVDRIASVPSHTEMEFAVPLDNRLINRRQQHEIVLRQLRLTAYEQPMVLAAVASHHSRGSVTAILRHAYEFSLEGFLQIGKLGLVQFEMCHKKTFRLILKNMRGFSIGAANAALAPPARLMRGHGIRPNREAVQNSLQSGKTNFPEAVPGFFCPPGPSQAMPAFSTSGKPGHPPLKNAEKRPASLPSA